MKILNISKGFSTGKIIVAIKEFKNGSIDISVGDQGIVKKITIESFPDFGLFDVRILHMKFGKHELSIGEQIAKGYFNTV
jgi:hypothetical protein